MRLHRKDPAGRTDKFRHQDGIIAMVCTDIGDMHARLDLTPHKRRNPRLPYPVHNNMGSETHISARHIELVTAHDAAQDAAISEIRTRSARTRAALELIAIESDNFIQTQKREFVRKFRGNMLTTLKQRFLFPFQRLAYAAKGSHGIV